MITPVSYGKINRIAMASLVLGPLLFSIAGCVSSSSPTPPASNTTVVVPPSSRSTTVICSDGSGPPCR